MISKITKASLLVLIYLNEALGHGFMYFPTTWNSRNEIKPCNGLKGAHFGYKHEPLHQEDDVCDSSTGIQCSHSALSGGWTTEWFTNFTFSAGQPSMSEEMYYNGRVSTKIDGEEQYNPWSQPGTAPVYGEGCGLNGGNPNGCRGVDPSPFGTCCGGGKSNGQWKAGCGGYTGGKSALEHVADGLFGDSFTTTWTRGKAEPVYWSSGAGHYGGYAYRLCKIPAGGITQITEECFNQGHLYFVGDTNWIYSNIQPYDTHDYSKWEEVPAIRTTDGTFPPGSEWTKINVAANKARGWGFKDYVQIPEDIEAGSYILSFRWDSQRTPQIWSNCANIEVV